MAIDSEILLELAALDLPQDKMTAVLKLLAKSEAKYESQNAAVLAKRIKDRERKRNVRGMSVENPEPKEKAPLSPPSMVSHTLPFSPLISPQKKTRERMGLAELSVEHIRDWLAEKQAGGVYVGYDPGFVLEQLRDYCQSHGKTYKDYVAAYRNAFAWDKCKPQTQRKNYATNNREQKDRAFIESGDRILALTEAFIRDKNS